MTERQPFTGPTGADRDPAVVDADAFLEALSRGQDPAGGADPLATAFLGLRAECTAPAAVPDFEALLRDIDTGISVTAAGIGAVGGGSDATPTCTSFPAVTPLPGSATPDRASAATTVCASHAADGTTDGGAVNTTGDTVSAGADGGVVDELAARRARARKASARPGAWLGHGLIGAAAATLVIAGGGAMVYSAQPGDALWGVHESLFTDHAAVVQLASTLEEADDAGAKGDVAGALQLLEKARAMAQDMNKPQPVKRIVSPPVTTSVTITADAEPTTVTVAPGDGERPPAEPATATVTVSVTVTPTVVRAVPSAVNLPPGVKPTTSAVPLSALMPSTTPRPTAATSTTSTSRSAAATTVAPTSLAFEPVTPDGVSPSTGAAPE